MGKYFLHTLLEVVGTAIPTSLKRSTNNVLPCSRHHTEIGKHELDTVNFNTHLEHKYMYIHSVYTVHAHFYLCLVHVSTITFI